MKALKRWLSRNARLRYWKRRALHAERRLDAAIAVNAEEVKELREQLEAERWRNLAREDSFVSATVMGSRNMWGVAPRTAPAPKPKQVGASPTLPQYTPEWQGLSAVDRMEWETQWLPIAQERGIPKEQAMMDFMADVAKRRTLVDEPYN